MHTAVNSIRAGQRKIPAPFSLRTLGVRAAPLGPSLRLQAKVQGGTFAPFQGGLTSMSLNLRTYVKFHQLCEMLA